MITTRYPNGNICSISKFVNETLHSYTEWYPTGTIYKHLKYQNGMLHGESFGLAQDGTEMFRTTFIHGNGTCRVYDKTLLYMYSLKNGLYDGEYIEYFPNGQAKNVKQFSAGQLHGLSRCYWPTGVLKCEHVYEHGKQISSTKEKSWGSGNYPN